MYLRAPIFLFVIFFASFAWGVDPNDPRWQELVVGQVSDLPSGPIKSFLHATHFNNVYAKQIQSQTRALGPFAPEANNIFWLPTLELPMDSDTWRFLSDMEKLPNSILENAFIQKDGQTFIKMFLHPYSTEAPVFIKLAKKYGGFKYEFQAATTASVRSFVAWKTEHPKPEGAAGKLELPSDPQKFIWPKSAYLIPTSMALESTP